MRIAGWGLNLCLFVGGSDPEKKQKYCRVERVSKRTSQVPLSLCWRQNKHELKMNLKISNIAGSGVGLTGCLCPFVGGGDGGR